MRTTSWAKSPDNGTGKIRGIYLQGNEEARAIFSTWMQPFQDMGMTTISIRNTSGTDHLAFDAVGLPGFQFIQDPVEYNTRTHHSNMDVYDRIQRADMMQAAIVEHIALERRAAAVEVLHTHSTGVGITNID